MLHKEDSAPSGRLQETILSLMERGAANPALLHLIQEICSWRRCAVVS